MVIFAITTLRTASQSSFSNELPNIKNLLYTYKLLRFDYNSNQKINQFIIIFAFYYVFTHSFTPFSLSFIQVTG